MASVDPEKSYPDPRAALTPLLTLHSHTWWITDHHLVFLVAPYYASVAWERTPGKTKGAGYLDARRCTGHFAGSKLFNSHSHYSQVTLLILILRMRLRMVKFFAKAR